MAAPAHDIDQRFRLWSIANSTVLLVLLILTGTAAGHPALLPAVLAAGTTGTLALLFWVRPTSAVDSRRQKLKRADWTTLIRFIITGSIALLMISAPAELLEAASYAVLVLGIISVVLDGIDGAYARRDGPTRFGSILDMEGDTYFMSVVITAAVTRLHAPFWAIFLVLCRFLFVLIRIRRASESELPRWTRRPVQVNGVFGTCAIGIWYMACIPRPAASAILAAAVVLNVTMFLLTCYLARVKESTVEHS